MEPKDAENIAANAALAEAGPELAAGAAPLLGSFGLPALAVGCGCLLILLIFGGLFAAGAFALNNPLNTQTASTGSASGGTTSGGSSSGGTTSGAGPLAPSCGSKGSALKPPSLTQSQCKSSVSGHITSVKSSNGFYRSTTFGCSKKGERDGDDNCDPGCSYLSSVNMNINGNVTTVKLPHGAYVYEETLHYFSANSVQYGCNATLLVTNVKTGQAVVVKAIDGGPCCGGSPCPYKMQIDGNGMIFDYSKTAAKAIGDPSVVKVDKVATDTPVGPVSSCPTSLNTIKLNIDNLIFS